MNIKTVTAPDKLTPCEFCGHPYKDHCKGGVEHLSTQTKFVASNGIKEVFDQNGKPRWKTTCNSRHCEQPLCCCIEFQEKEKQNVLPKSHKNRRNGKRGNILPTSKRSRRPVSKGGANTR